MRTIARPVRRSAVEVEEIGMSEVTSVSARRYYEVSAAESAGQLARLRARGAEGRVLLRGGTVVSMDPAIGDFDAADVLVVGDRIAAVGPDLSAAAADGQAIVVDVGGMVVMPGLVDAHRHCWQNQFRGLIVDASIGEYLATMHAGFARAYQPDDMYVGDLVTMVGLLDAGVTTVLDFSHNSRSRAHSDAVFRAYADAGIRAVHASSAPSAGEWDEQWPLDLERLRDTYHCPDGLTTVRMGLVEMRPWPLERMVAYARELGLRITFDGVAGDFCRDVEALGKDGLLGPDFTVIHCSGITEQAWGLMADAEVGVTLATTSDEQIGMGNGITAVQEALDHGIRPSLSGDVEVSLAADMFTQMRQVLTTQRMHQTQAAYEGRISRPAYITNRDVLEMATVQAAADIGLGDAVGSLTPGKFADIVAIAAEEFGNLPLNNAIGTIVQGTDRSAVRHVLVAGRPRKWAGILVDQDINAVREMARRSRDRVAAQAGFVYTPANPYQPVETPEMAAFADSMRRRPIRG
jgi:5-methylthioadenosine/S-adenosylhomocysteine deaminase